MFQTEVQRCPSWTDERSKEGAKKVRGGRKPKRSRRFGGETTRGPARKHCLFQNMHATKCRRRLCHLYSVYRGMRLYARLFGACSTAGRRRVHKKKKGGKIHNWPVRRRFVCPFCSSSLPSSTILPGQLYIEGRLAFYTPRMSQLQLVICAEDRSCRFVRENKRRAGDLC